VISYRKQGQGKRQTVGEPWRSGYWQVLPGPSGGALAWGYGQRERDARFPGLVPCQDHPDRDSGQRVSSAALPPPALETSPPAWEPMACSRNAGQPHHDARRTPVLTSHPRRATVSRVPRGKPVLRQNSFVGADLRFAPVGGCCRIGMKSHISGYTLCLIRRPQWVSSRQSRACRSAVPHPHTGHPGQPPGLAHDLFRVSVTIVTLTRNKSRLLTGATGKYAHSGHPGGTGGRCFVPCTTRKARESG
jgi:hypothetical protein